MKTTRRANKRFFMIYIFVAVFLIILISLIVLLTHTQGNFYLIFHYLLLFLLLVGVILLLKFVGIKTTPQDLELMMNYSKEGLDLTA